VRGWAQDLPHRSKHLDGVAPNEVALAWTTGRTNPLITELVETAAELLADRRWSDSRDATVSDGARDAGQRSPDRPLAK
jgi:hypothetical protein